MYFVVLALGIIAAAVGAIGIAWGITIKEFSLGNTLLVAGTTTFVGGLVMIAVAGAIRELRRIADALSNRPMMPRFPRPGEPIEPGAMRPGMAAPRGPMPPMGAPLGTMPPMGMVPPQRRPETPGADMHSLEPRPSAASAAPTPAPSVAPIVPAAPVPADAESPAPAITPERDNAAAPGTATTEIAAETIMVEESDAFPLSPQQKTAGEETERRSAKEPDEPHEPIFDFLAERNASRDPDVRGDMETATLTEPDEQVTTQPSADTTEAESEQAPVSSPALPFDAIWPARTRTIRRNEQAKDAAAAEEPHAPDARMDRETVGDTVEQAEPAAGGEASQAAESEAKHSIQSEAEHAGNEPASAPEPPHAVSILKSGVVDGMAYTLYSDGSIEAELAGETIRFGSITELRQHIEAST